MRSSPRRWASCHLQDARRHSLFRLDNFRDGGKTLLVVINHFAHPHGDLGQDRQRNVGVLDQVGQRHRDFHDTGNLLGFVQGGAQSSRRDGRTPRKPLSRGTGHSRQARHVLVEQLENFLRVNRSRENRAGSDFVDQGVGADFERGGFDDDTLHGRQVAMRLSQEGQSGGLAQL
jgi:hypothetical protein